MRARALSAHRRDCRAEVAGRRPRGRRPRDDSPFLLPAPRGEGGRRPDERQGRAGIDRSFELASNSPSSKFDDIRPLTPLDVWELPITDRATTARSFSPHGGEKVAEGRMRGRTAPGVRPTPGLSATPERAPAMRTSARMG